LISHVRLLTNAKNAKANISEKTVVFKNMIHDLREKLKKRLNEDFLVDFGIEKKQEIISPVEMSQQEIYNWYSNTMKIAMEYCISVVGEPPSRHALVGMGSLARKEATPYSDFEHMIIFEEVVQNWKNYKDVLEYFRWLSVIFHIVIVNLGETNCSKCSKGHLF